MSFWFILLTAFFFFIRRFNHFHFHLLFSYLQSVQGCVIQRILTLLGQQICGDWVVSYGKYSMANYLALLRSKSQARYVNSGNGLIVPTQISIVMTLFRMAFSRLDLKWPVPFALWNADWVEISISQGEGESCWIVAWQLQVIGLFFFNKPIQEIRVFSN